MYLRTNKGIININKARTISAVGSGVLCDNPCISIRFSNKHYFEIETPNLAAAQSKLNEIEQALRAEVTFFDMR